jgi:hypothetical protein
LRGELTLDGSEYGNRLLEGDSCVLLANLKYTLRTSADLEMLEVCLPTEGLRAAL